MPEQLSSSKVQGAEDVRLFVAVIGIYCLDTMRGLLRLAGPQAFLACSMGMLRW